MGLQMGPRGRQEPGIGDDLTLLQPDDMVTIRGVEFVDLAARPAFGSASHFRWPTKKSWRNR